MTLLERWKRLDETHPEPRHTLDDFSCRAALARAIAQRDLLVEVVQQMLSAVSAGRFQIECDDVDGANWFDTRDAILATLKPSTEVPRE